MTIPQMQALGSWPDSALGVERLGPNDYRFWGSARQNGKITTTRGTLGNLTAQPSETQVGIVIKQDLHQVPPLVTYYGGGPVYTDPSTQTKIMFTHLERHRDDLGPLVFQGTTALSRQDPNGDWQYLGEIFQHGTGTTCFPATGPVVSANADDPPYVVRNVGGVPYFYVYFRGDQLFNSTPNSCANLIYRRIGVMRAKVADVITAAVTGGVSPWHKYCNHTDPTCGPDDWGQLALGGRSTDLWPAGVPATAGTPWSVEVKWSSWHNGWVMFGERAYEVIHNIQWKSSLFLMESSDGITWTGLNDVAAVSYFGNGPKAYYWHPTAVGTGSDPQDLGHEFYVYYMRNNGTTDLGPYYRRSIRLDP